jgi:FtsP/CotA-like multicopper oxidase with cupredoxin domain
MDPREWSPIPGPASSRRRFLARGARLAAGTTLAPALLLGAAGCRGRATWKPAEGLLFRAGRLEGAPHGMTREIWAYNGQYPGPLIRAKEGETLRIRVINDLGVPTSIHWHGMHQHGTWTMDGVEEVSRPPIPPGSEFVYEFRAAPSGTHWYHSHVGVQYGNGLFGPLIVEERTPIASYDREEVLLFNDCFRELGDALLAKLLKAPAMPMSMPGMPDMGKMPGKKEMPDKKEMPGMKMEGMPGAMEMKKDVADVPFQMGHFNGKGRGLGDAKAPLSVVEVKPGETLRLRLINGSSTFAMRFQVDDHPLTVIATDGSPVKPVVVDHLPIGNGERYDVLLKAEREGVHWIRAVTPDGNEILAVLRYAGAGRPEPEPSTVRWGPRPLTPEALRAPEPSTLAERPREIPLVLGGSMSPYRWSINDQFYPKADPIAIREGEPIRFLIKNPTAMDHPFHLHGHSFRVLGRPDAPNLTDPVLKDTVNVPANGELALQWVADNPGRWFFHCHIEWHLATGMARVLEIAPS